MPCTTSSTCRPASLVAKEVEDGTSEIWLSIPASRWRLLLAKMTALAVALLGVVVAGVLGVQLSAVLVGATVSATGLLALGAVMTAFLFVIAAYSGLLSSMFSSRGVASGIAFGITLASYVVWLVGGLSDQWRQLKNLSIFTAYTPQKALETGSIDATSLGIVVAITVVCVLASLLTFQRRDAI